MPAPPPLSCSVCHLLVPPRPGLGQPGPRVPPRSAVPTAGVASSVGAATASCGLRRKGPAAVGCVTGSPDQPPCSLTGDTCTRGSGTWPLLRRTEQPPPPSRGRWAPSRGAQEKQPAARAVPTTGPSQPHTWPAWPHTHASYAQHTRARARLAVTAHTQARPLLTSRPRHTCRSHQLTRTTHTRDNTYTHRLTNGQKYGLACQGPPLPAPQAGCPGAPPRGQRGPVPCPPRPAPASGAAAPRTPAPRGPLEAGTGPHLETDGVLGQGCLGGGRSPPDQGCGSLALTCGALWRLDRAVPEAGLGDRLL